MKNALLSCCSMRGERFSYFPTHPPRRNLKAPLHSISHKMGARVLFASRIFAWLAVLPCGCQKCVFPFGLAEFSTLAKTDNSALMCCFATRAPCFACGGAVPLADLCSASPFLAVGICLHINLLYGGFLSWLSIISAVK